MRNAVAWLGWFLIEFGDRLNSGFLTPRLYHLGSRLEVWGTERNDTTHLLGSPANAERLRQSIQQLEGREVDWGPPRGSEEW